MRTQVKVMLSIPAALLATACASHAAKQGTTRATAAVAAPAAASPARAFVVAPQRRPAHEIEFKAVLDLPQAGGKVSAQLRGSVYEYDAEPKEWPASLFATFDDAGGTYACTAALIGPQAMLTAAHCVPPSGVVRFTYKYQDSAATYVTSCRQHPQYAGNKDASADFALCKVDRPFVAPGGFLYETVNTSSMTHLLNQRVLLSGYGCTSDNAREDGTDGKYRIGFNRIDETSASASQRRGAEFYTGRQENNLFTSDDPTLANLCPGDSGGPAFSSSGGPGQFTSRTIIGVNSRVFFRDDTRTTYGSSLLSATGGPAFRAWAEDWARNAGVAACGLSGNLTNCRS